MDSSENNEIMQKMSEKLVWIVLLTMFTIVLWGGVKIIEAFTSKPSAINYEAFTRTLPTQIDRSTLGELQQRQEEYEEISLEEFHKTEEATDDTDNDSDTTTETEN